MNSSDDEFDPLNIGKVSCCKPIVIDKPKAITLSKEKTAKVDLFELKEKKNNRKSLMLTNKKPLDIFGTDLESFYKKNESSITKGFTIGRQRRSSSQIKPDYIPMALQEDFTPFIDSESIGSKFQNPTKSFKEARTAVLNRDILTIKSKIKEMKVELNLNVIRRSETLLNKNAIIVKLLSYKNQGMEQNRNSAIIQSIIQRKISRRSKLEADRYRNIIERCSQFIEWLKEVPNKYPLTPTIEIDKFLESFEKPSPKIAKIEKQISILEKHVKPMKASKPGTGTWFEETVNPQTSSGMIIKKFEETVAKGFRENNLKIKYDDLFLIIEKLNVDDKHFDQLEHLLFDIGWRYRDYPFGIYRENYLPKISDLFPAAIAKTELEEEYAFASFNALNGMQWPFKSSVDMLFNMMILTNPFDIARVFWDVIQETAQSMKMILVVNKGIEPEDVEIDFDSLFPVLEIIIFVFGLDEWMTCALYTMSFNEQVSDDPQLQFSMTYLEGLVTQIMSIDVPKIRQKAAKLKHQWIDNEEDPLGVSSQ